MAEDKQKQWRSRTFPTEVSIICAQECGTQREAGQGAKPPPPHTSPPDFIGCASRQPQRATSEGSENDGDYSPGFILTVNFSHSGYKVN